MTNAPFVIECTCCGQLFETFPTSTGYQTRRCFLCRMQCPRPGDDVVPKCARQTPITRPQ